ncbi:hypothetical protein GUJ93_ZPchr0010g9847 [Zizania palustris]|uniref:BED-type domain-containing protein n=1 Tax=Zizania palustris TaxID=103762 RepID=A0A8J5WER5_ZIZPA|nr:hypothetical protein GUJ93_ZPchr0010g9847 [Zizania palustris]
MDHMDEHDSDDLPLGGASDGGQVAFRLRNKKRSKVWDEYDPVYVNGVVQSAECRYCHILMSCKGSEGHSNGTSHLWRHQKICRAKDELGLSQLQDTDFPNVLNDIDPVDQIHPDSLDDINLASHSDYSRFRSKVWNEFRPDELSPAMTNGKVQIAEYASKLLKGNSSVDRTPQNQHILALPAQDNMTSKEQIPHLLMLLQIYHKLKEMLIQRNSLPIRGTCILITDSAATF